MTIIKPIRRSMIVKRGELTFYEKFKMNISVEDLRRALS
ncbi:hypothetical protein LEP1GSC133_4405 [Leptospira borgpetersenii serovar Pomona str. 200901868]|uniref:Uncharacterized protein n=1 Tax=Leptospira borgpetersenii serovar Pomona str. 200901868 TaxID=1192866 RepID=M6W619_LEPBO|nr:hypothetical protein LEP1GSC133_4405 [Leptospira borgpetersenii serovar Pomona str. 200901868]